MGIWSRKVKKNKKDKLQIKLQKQRKNNRGKILNRPRASSPKKKEKKISKN
jgi:hypothetical protein